MATEIQSFWVGAMLYGTVEEVDGVLRMGVSPHRIGESHLVQAGVTPRRARAWVRTSSSRTRGGVITAVDRRYPARLRGIPDAPPVLLVEGDASCLDIGPSVGIVGTRACTAYGRSLARTLGHALARQGALVVSGLARGIDAAAHQGAADGGRTLAVLGHGLAHTSPASNLALRHRIIERGGLVLSTWPDAVEPARWTFPRRNRWIAALSQHVVVVEAPVRSGALITARDALELGGSRVWAAPGPVGASASAGCLELIRRGDAQVLTSVAQLVQAVTGALPPQEQDWVARLCAGASLDEVARMRDVSTLELLRELTRLELMGEVVRLPGQRYARTGGAG